MKSQHVNKFCLRKNNFLLFFLFSVQSPSIMLNNGRGLNPYIWMKTWLEKGIFTSCSQLGYTKVLRPWVYNYKRVKSTLHLEFETSTRTGGSDFKSVTFICCLLYYMYVKIVKWNNIRLGYRVSSAFLYSCLIPVLKLLVKKEVLKRKGETSTNFIPSLIQKWNKD